MPVLLSAVRGVEESEESRQPEWLKVKGGTGERRKNPAAGNPVNPVMLSKKNLNENPVTGNPFNLVNPANPVKKHTN
ncbi:hypothetical protein [Dyadobacter sp. NIV53]|uniref:hypothetical protein n=1 Tax=Dyadobacter sp. NIV53 TaxID=2861765 RepID=UPI001C88D4C9|nr:hypothetical protein [Dyadobacter sp. NIV53]